MLFVHPSLLCDCPHFAEHSKKWTTGTIRHMNKLDEGLARVLTARPIFLRILLFFQQSGKLLSGKVHQAVHFLLGAFEILCAEGVHCDFFDVKVQAPLH